MSAAENRPPWSWPPGWTPEEDARLLELPGAGSFPTPDSRGPGPHAAQRRRSGVQGRMARRGGAEAEEAKARGRHRVPPRSVLPARACQYIGDQGDDPRAWSHCGRPCMEGRSYCAEHTAICYDKEATRRRSVGP